MICTISQRTKYLQQVSSHRIITEKSTKLFYSSHMTVECGMILIKAKNEQIKDSV